MLNLFLLATVSTAEAKKTVNVTKTQAIEAPADVVWTYVSDYSTWKNWTAWNVEMDPEATWTISGDPGTVGHTSEWNGPELGEGKMVTTVSEANTTYTYDLFFDGKDKAYPGGLTLAEADGVTTVSWDFNMEMGAIGKALFGKKIVEAIGGDFEKGLASLATLAEADAAAARLAAAEALVTEKTAAADAASATVTEAEAAVTAAGEAKTAADEALKKARRKSDKAAAQTAVDEATAAATAADEALAAAKTAQEAAAAELSSATEALNALKPQATEEPAEAPEAEAPEPSEEQASEAPAESAPE